MKLNFIGFLSLTIVLISLLFPWWSMTRSNLHRYKAITGEIDESSFGAVTIDMSAFFGNMMGFTVYEDLTYNSWNSHSFNSPQNQFYWNTSSLIFLLTLAFIFGILAVSLGAFGCIAVGSWSNQGRKMFLVMGLVFSCVIFLQLWYDIQIWDVGISETKQIITQHEGTLYISNDYGVTSTYPNIGFYLAVAGVVSALMAWRYPKWFHVRIGESRAHMARWIRWLEIPEREKLTTLFLSSLLMSYLLVFLLVFVF